MKTCLLSLGLLLAAGRALAQTPAADEAAIRQAVARMTTNWQNHQFADMAAYTTPDVSWVNIVGMWWRGRAQVQQAHQEIFDTIFKGVAFKPGPPTVRTIAPGVAVVNMYCHVGAFYPPRRHRPRHQQGRRRRRPAYAGAGETPGPLAALGWPKHRGAGQRGHQQPNRPGPPYPR